MTDIPLHEHVVAVFQKGAPTGPAVRHLRLWLADCAERTLPLYARINPDDTRLSDAVDAMRAVAEGNAPRGDLRRAVLRIDEIRMPGEVEDRPAWLAVVAVRETGALFSFADGRGSPHEVLNAMHSCATAIAEPKPAWERTQAYTEETWRQASLLADRMATVA